MSNEQLMRFFENNFLEGISINALPPLSIFGISFSLFLYGIVLLMTFIGTLILVSIYKKFSFDLFLKSLVISFLFSGFLFAFRMDLNWSRLLIHDIRHFFGKYYGDKIDEMAGSDIYRFSEFAKKNIPSGARVKLVMNDDSTASNRLKYYMLPVETSSSADYLCIYFDPDSYAALIKTLTEAEGKLSGYSVGLVSSYMDRGGIFKRTRVER